MKFLGTTRQAIAAIGAMESELSGEPMALALEHVVAVFAVGFHIVSGQKVAEPQNFRNIDVLRAGQAVIALGAEPRNRLERGVHACPNGFEAFFSLKDGEVLLEVFRLGHA